LSKRATYNYKRDYDPAIGRYIESDPIGLAGGSYSTYTYARGNPLSYFDPYGLASCWLFDCPSLPQGVVNVGVGLGDGIIAALTLNQVSGQDVRDLIPYTRGTNGGADSCSKSYSYSYAFGVYDALIAEVGAGAIEAGIEPGIRATVATLQLLTGTGEVATAATEAPAAIEQLQSVVETLEEEGLERPVIPPPGHPRF
jgi:hypothetical protein